MKIDITITDAKPEQLVTIAKALGVKLRNLGNKTEDEFELEHNYTFSFKTLKKERHLKCERKTFLILSIPLSI